MRRTGSLHSGSAGLRGPVAPRIPKLLVDAELPRDDLVDEAELTSLAFTGVDLSEREVTGADVEKSRLETCRLGPGRWDRVCLSDCAVSGCDLANLRTRDSSLLRVSVISSRATGLSFTDGAMKEVRWESCRADLASFRFTRFTAALFTGCNLSQADFQEADLRGAVFVDCDLTGAQFSNATMTGTRFSRCTLLDVAGVQAMRGAVVDARDITDLAYSLAGALGIVIDG